MIGQKYNVKKTTESNGLKSWLQNAGITYDWGEGWRVEFSDKKES